MIFAGKNSRPPLCILREVRELDAEMGNRVVILSPHRDDAAFSCGLLMSLCVERGTPVHIVNIFTRSTYAPYLPVPPGVETLHAVSAARLEEDRALGRRLGDLCQMDDLALTDAPVRLGTALDEVLSGPLPPERQRVAAEQLAAQMRDLVVDERTLVFAPLALGGHVDHTLVRDAALLSVPCERLALYEDLPYAARLDTAEKTAFIRALLGEVVTAEPIVVSAEDGMEGSRKREFAALYPSQIDAAVVDEMARYAEQVGGERFYACADRGGPSWLDAAVSGERDSVRGKAV